MKLGLVHYLDKIREILSVFFVYAYFFLPLSTDLSVTGIFYQEHPGSRLPWQIDGAICVTGRAVPLNDTTFEELDTRRNNIGVLRSTREPVNGPP